MQKNVFEEALICGGVNFARIAANNWSKESTERFVKSRQASQLGQFVTHCALRSPDADDPIYLHSQVPIILGQDLYCLATSHSDRYLPWPRIATNSSTSHSSKLDSKSGGMGGQEDVLADGLNYGCMRRVVMRDLPYEHVVDRRCVWKFYVVDNSNDFKSMSSKEQRAQKLLKKARKGLNKSRRFRQGGHLHGVLKGTGEFQLSQPLPKEEYAKKQKQVALDGKPLVSGESFAQTLREMVAQSTLKLETESLDTRRKKEDHIENHFKKLYHQCVTKIEREWSHDQHSSKVDAFDDHVSMSSSLSKSLSAAALSYEDNAPPTVGSSHVSFHSPEAHPLGGGFSVSVASDKSLVTPNTRKVASRSQDSLSKSAPVVLGETVQAAGVHGGHRISSLPIRSPYARKQSSSTTNSASSALSNRTESEAQRLHKVMSRKDGSEGDSLLDTHELLSEGRQYALTQLQPNRAASNRVQEVPVINQGRLEDLFEMDRKVQQALNFRSREFQARHIASTVFNSSESPAGIASSSHGGVSSRGTFTTQI